jgi:hypothetical protein
MLRKCTRYAAHKDMYDEGPARVTGRGLRLYTWLRAAYFGAQ